MKPLVSFLLLPTLGAFALHASGPDLKEGSWHITSTSEITGMPMGDSTMPSESVQCLTRDNMVPSSNEAPEACTISDEVVTASSVSWTIACPNATGSGSVRYHHDRFEGETKMEMMTPMGAINVTTTMEGEYLGPCE